MLSFGSGLGGVTETSCHELGSQMLMDSPIDWGLLGSGQHHGVKKCSVVCSKMHPEINVDFLVNYQRTEASCRKPAIM